MTDTVTTTEERIDAALARERRAFTWVQCLVEAIRYRKTGNAEARYHLIHNTSALLRLFEADLLLAAELVHRWRQETLTDAGDVGRRILEDERG